MKNKETKMKRGLCILLITGFILFLNSAIVFASAEDIFSKTYEETEIITGELLEGISEALGGEALQVAMLVEKADKLIANSKTLEKAAIELGKKDSAAEAAQMVSYMTRIKETLEKGGKETDQLAITSARFYLHYNNCLMNYPGYLKIMLNDHVEELKNALKEGHMEEVSHLAEHLHLHCDQMYYSAMIFGKKIWQKFSVQSKAIADKIFEAAQKDDIDAVKAGIKEIEKPVGMLLDLVK